MSKPLYQPQGIAEQFSTTYRYRNMANQSEYSILAKTKSNQYLVGLCNYNQAEVKIKKNNIKVNRIKFIKSKDVYRGTDTDTGLRLERIADSSFWYPLEESPKMTQAINMYRSLTK